MTDTDAFPIVAIDGGAASGKSSTARGVAERLNFLHVDTGAHYRAVTLAALRAGISVDDREALRDFLQDFQLDSAIDGHSACVRIAGTQTGDEELRALEVNQAVSAFAACALVREAVLEYQRAQPNVARAHGFAGLVMEGRDIGSVIFPDSRHKFFLEADEATRQERRRMEGQDDSVGARDAQDAGRKTAPLLCPEDAVRIDTGRHSLEEVIDLICRRIPV